MNLDAAVAEGCGASPAPKSPSTPDNMEVQEAKEDTAQMDDTENIGEERSNEAMNNSVNLDELTDALTDIIDKEGGTKESGDEEKAPATAPATSPSADDLEIDFSKLKKKKKSKRRAGLSEFLTIHEETVGDADDKEGECGADEKEEDYTYNELLERAFTQLKKINPELASNQ